MSPSADPQPELAHITDLTTDEMIQLLDWQDSRFARWLAFHLLRLGVSVFARHVLRYENWIQEAGWSAANQRAVDHYLRSLTVCGAGQVPAAGPVLWVANHPGITDFMAISAASRRDDLAILAYTRPFLSALPGISNHIIPLSTEPGLRFQAVRHVVRHLQAGGSVLTFPAGTGEPDPLVMPGAVASLDTWQPSMGVLARCVPGLQIVPTLVSGVQWAPTLNLGFVRRLPSTRRKIRVAGTLQVMWQTVTGKPLTDVRVDFAPPLAALDTGERILESVKDQMRGLVAALPTPDSGVFFRPASRLNVPPHNQLLR
jgi:hypothetical protein